MNKSTSEANDQPSILVVAALTRELAVLKKRRLEGTAFLTLGIGRKNAERRLQGWFKHDRADAVICLGFAGALSSQLAIADLVVDKSGWGENRLLNNPPSASIYFGKVITVDEIVGAQGKRQLAAEFEATEIACVEMESAAVAQVCRQRNIPYLLVRAISDLFDEDFPIDFNRCRNESGEVSTSKVMQAVLRRPQALKPLLELSRRTEVCAERLAKFLEQLLPAIRQTLAAERKDATI